LAPAAGEPALLATAVLSLLVFLAALLLTATGQALLAEEPDWVPAALLTSGTAVVALPAFLAARHRRSVPGLPAGMDAALRGVTVHPTVRTLAAGHNPPPPVQQGPPTRGCPAVFSPGAFGDAVDPAAGSWWPATLAGSVLGAAATVIAVIPVRVLARAGSAPARRPDKEPAE
jgi:hypothetical protein